MATIPEALAIAVEHHRAGRWRQAADVYQEILRVDPQHVETWHLLGVLTHRLGRHETAIDCFRHAAELRPNAPQFHNNLGAACLAANRADEAVAASTRAVQLDPQFAEAYFNLGNSLASQGRYDQAVANYRQAVAIRPDYAEAHGNLGNALQDSGQLEAAVRSYQRAVAVRADFAAAHRNLGLALRAQGKLDQAVASLRRAVEIEPRSVDALWGLGNALTDQDRLDEAADSYQQVLRIAPNHAGAHLNLGNVLARQGRIDEAIDQYRRALSLRPDYAEARMNLGSVLKSQGDLEAAVAAYRQAVELHPDCAEAHNGLGNALKEQDRLGEAAAAYGRALELQPAHPLWELRAVALCPTVFDGRQQIDAYLARLLAEIERFGGRPLRIDLGEVCTEISTSGAEPPAALQFIPGDVRPVKEAYARLFRGALPMRPPLPRKGRLPRIGFVVTQRHEGIFLRSMRGVLKHITAGLFELTVVCHRSGYTRIRQALADDPIEVLPVCEPFDQIVETIREARFDLLHYWEVGTDAINYFLPFCRPAPVQCTSWGIQVTTGIPAMDYYLSSASVEGPDAADHYSEALVLADTLLTYQYRAALPETPKTRGQLGFGDDRHLYLCAQHLGKLHPDFDPTLAAILQRDDRGVVVLTADRGGYLAAKLRRRLAATIPEVGNRIVLLPRQSYADYLSLIAAADVLLDPLYFGGVNTTYDAFSLNRPIVTLPSAFHRGRYTLGCYRKMGIADCVATDPEDYVQKAVQLATDATYRAEVEQRIGRASAVLFEDSQAVREHERIFQELLHV
ncbi:MAG: tetratricopeptide repeat protein [Pirellulales bacterium]|nr:tetratricopeptide repeat protein [Pirellulales bacterium]